MHPSHITGDDTDLEPPRWCTYPRGPVAQSLQRNYFKLSNAVTRTIHQRSQPATLDRELRLRTVIVTLTEAGELFEPVHRLPLIAIVVFVPIGKCTTPAH